MSQSVEPATDPFVAAAGPGMVAQRAAIHPCADRLLRGEIPGLRLCLSIESIVIYVRHIEDISTQIHDGLALSGSASMGEEQVEDRFGLLAPELVVQR